MVSQSIDDLIGRETSKLVSRGYEGEFIRRNQNNRYIFYIRWQERKDERMNEREKMFETEETQTNFDGLGLLLYFLRNFVS